MAPRPPGCLAGLFTLSQNPTVAGTTYPLVNALGREGGAFLVQQYPLLLLMPSWGNITFEATIPSSVTFLMKQFAALTLRMANDRIPPVRWELARKVEKPMQFGLYLRSFMSDPSRPLYEQIEEVVEICHVARDLGFSAVSVPQHWISHPTVWPHPYPLLARLAPETGDMGLLAGIILLPLHNPVDIAEATVTLDHISKGRFILGVGLGYRKAELEAAGITRRDRVPRLTESLELMKHLWSGEEVTFEGRYWSLHNARIGVTPVQQPHPPIWMAAQSAPAVRRAAQLADACYLAPQVGFDDLKMLVEVYRAERAEMGGNHPGKVAITRGISMASTHDSAIRSARQAAESSYRMYGTWEMQEESMVRIHISSDSKITDWAVVGSAEDCLERFVHLQDDLGVDYVGLTILNLPKDLTGRKEYLAEFSEKIFQRMN